MTMRVAVLLEQGEFREELLRSLQSQYEVNETLLSRAGLQRLQSWRPNLVLYDAQESSELPEERFRELRARVTVPILVLAPHRDEGFTVRALKLGADGCLSGPVGADELQARVAAHLRRYWEWSARTDTFVQNSASVVCVDPETCSVTLRDRTIRLTPTECRLLCRLKEQEGQVVPRQELSRYLWGLEGDHGGAGLVSLYIHYLRQKLEEDPRYPRYIRTRRGGGYYLAGEGA
ncbi:MAG: response regulator transcription factor [Chloroflexi bacterium]|nr:response regulator transcription factor [Chloroflexota bacterium]